MDEKVKKSTVYDLIFRLIQDNKIEPENLFNFLEFYWPTFITYKNYVFLNEKFSESYFEQLQKQNEKIEFWMNLLTVDSYFDCEDFEEKARFLAQSLVELWKTKLKKDFPNIEFTVTYLEDKEAGDYGLTFYQKVTD